MRFTVWLDQAVEVNLSTEDIATVLLETETKDALLQALGNAVSFLRAIPESLIGELSPTQRARMAGFLRTEAARIDNSEGEK